MADKKNFRVITNENEMKHDTKRERMREYQTNPLKMQSNSLKEDLMKFTNGEAGRRFSVEDLLRGC